MENETCGSCMFRRRSKGTMQAPISMDVKVCKVNGPDVALMPAANGQVGVQPVWPPVERDEPACGQYARKVDLRTVV